MTMSETLRLWRKRACERGYALHRAQVAAGADGEISEVSGGIVRHGVMFQVTPDAFDRVHFRHVGRQELQGDVTALRLDMFAHEFGAVRRQAVPDDQQLLANRSVQHFKELDDLRGTDAAVVEAEVESPEGDSRYHRHLLPAEAVLQHGFGPSGPGTDATRSLGQSRFVDEDDHSTLLRCDFFCSGHLLAFQRCGSPSRRVLELGPPVVPRYHPQLPT